MIDPKLFDDLRARIDEALRGSPAQDIEKNLRALLEAVEPRREQRAQAKLAELEARIAELETRKPR